MKQSSSISATRYTIGSAGEIPAEFGPLRKVRKTSTVKIRQPQAPREEFQKSWGTLIGIPGEDLVIYSDADPAGYPCKISVFAEAYEELASGSGQYRKKEITRLVPVPAGTEVLLKTLDGDEIVRHPDWIAVGKGGEVYANDSDWVKKNLEFVD